MEWAHFSVPRLAEVAMVYKHHEWDVCYDHVGEWKMFLDRRSCTPRKVKFWGIQYPLMRCGCGGHMWRMRETRRQFLTCQKCKRMRKRVLERDSARCQVCHEDISMSQWRPCRDEGGSCVKPVSTSVGTGFTVFI